MSDPNTPENDPILPSTGGAAAAAARLNFQLSYDENDFSPIPSSPAAWSSSPTTSHETPTTTSARAGSPTPGGIRAIAGSGADSPGATTAASSSQQRAAAAAATPPRLLGSFSLITTLLSTTDPGSKDKMFGQFLPVMATTVTSTARGQQQQPQSNNSNRSAAALFWEIGPSMMYHDAAARSRKRREELLGDFSNLDRQEEEEEADGAAAAAALLASSSSSPSGIRTLSTEANVDDDDFPNMDEDEMMMMTNSSSNGGENTTTNSMMMTMISTSSTLFTSSALPPLLPKSIRALFTREQAEAICVARDLLKAHRWHELPALPDAAYEILTLPTRPGDAQSAAVKRFVTPQLVGKLIGIQFTPPGIPFSTTDVAMSALPDLAVDVSSPLLLPSQQSANDANSSKNSSSTDDPSSPPSYSEQQTTQKQRLRLQQEEEQQRRRRHYCHLLDAAAARSQAYLFALWCRMLTRIANINRPLLDRDDVRDALTRNGAMLISSGDSAYFAMRLINHAVGDIEAVQARFCDSAMVKLVVEVVPGYLSTSDGVEWWAAGIALLCGKNQSRSDLFGTDTMIAALVQTAVHANSDASAKYWLKCLYRVLNGSRKQQVIDVVSRCEERLADALVQRVLPRVTQVGTTKQAAKLLNRLLEKVAQMQWVLGSKVMTRDILCGLVKTATDNETAANLSKAFSMLVSRSNEVRGFYIMGDGGVKVMAAMYDLAETLVKTAETAQREAAAKRADAATAEGSSPGNNIPAPSAAPTTKQEDGLCLDWLTMILHLAQWRNPLLHDDLFSRYDGPLPTTKPLETPPTKAIRSQHEASPLLAIEATAASLALISRIAFRKEPNANQWLRVVHFLLRGRPEETWRLVTPEMKAIVVDGEKPAISGSGSMQLWQDLTTRASDALRVRERMERQKMNATRSSMNPRQSSLGAGGEQPPISPVVSAPGAAAAAAAASSRHVDPAASCVSPVDGDGDEASFPSLSMCTQEGKGGIQLKRNE